MRKLNNRLKLLKDFYFKKEKVSGLPVELVIEATNLCNLNCVMCTRKNMKRKVGFMKWDLYKKIIDEVSEYMELIYLHGLGEPLFHPKIFEMIKYAKKKGLNVGISSNGTILSEEKSKKLLSCGLDYLILALDATSSKTYNKVRGGNFLIVLDNVKKYLSLKKKSKKSPFTVLQFVKLKENEKEAKDFQDYWKSSGAEVIRVKPVIDLLQENKAKKLVRRPCFYLWRQLNMVSWDGKFVTPCCMDTNGDYPLGDARKQSIKEIWNGKAMASLRNMHSKGEWRKISICRKCTYPQPSFYGKLGAMLVPDMQIKKVLPILERISFGKFVLYE